jgi:flagellar protein FlgJ
MVAELAKAEVYTDLQGLTELRARARNQSPEALKAVAQQFEALFTQMMLKSMREANEAMGEDLFESDQTALYRDMYDKQISLELSRGEGLGLADLLVRQLQGARAQAAGAVADKRASLSPSRPMEAAPKAPAVPLVKDPVRFDSPASFVETLWPHAQRAGEKLGVDPRALLAQAALETGWGKAVIRRADGGSSYNLFNIKADSRWDGERALKTTLEYRDGVARQEKAPFRAYGSYRESFEDYVQFLQSQPRYREALENAGDPAAFIGALHKAGYATDPAYAEKVQGIFNRYTEAPHAMGAGPLGTPRVSKKG